MKIKLVKLLGVALCLACAQSVAGSIDTTNKYAWAENAGWHNYAPTHGGVTVHPNGANGYLSGYVWAESIGWIKLGAGTGPYANTSASNYGVNLDAAGNLSGYAWSEIGGWINFHPTHSHVTINTTSGSFDGYAWSEFSGWIHFRNASPAYNVRINKADQTITFATIPDQIVTSQVTLAATADSALPVTFAVSSGPGVITGGTHLSFTGTGSVSIVASQEGNTIWNAATPVVNTFNVQPAISPISGILAADFDGDGKADPAIYDSRTGTWTVKLSCSDYCELALTDFLGGPGYIPAVADYDGDRLSDPAVYQEATGNWIILQSGSDYARLEHNAFLGGPGWAPDSADYEGDKKADYAVYQEATGNWKVKLSSAEYTRIDLNDFLGSPGYSAVSADYDGDGLADPAVYNRTDGTWKVLLSRASYFPLTLPSFLGGTGWDAVPGDYDGDGLADPAVRKSDGSEWRIMLSRSSYALISVPMGL